MPPPTMAIRGAAAARAFRALTQALLSEIAQADAGLAARLAAPLAELAFGADDPGPGRTADPGPS
jgi:hypothetical protein